MLYVIQQENSDIYKIGVSGSPGSRLEMLQCGNPQKLTLAAVFVVEGKDPLIIEAMAHSVAASLGSPIRGEWFEITLDKAIESVVLATSAADAKLHGLDDLRSVCRNIAQVKIRRQEEVRRAEMRRKMGIAA